MKLILNINYYKIFLKTTILFIIFYYNRNILNVEFLKIKIISFFIYIILIFQEQILLLILPMNIL